MVGTWVALGGPGRKPPFCPAGCPRGQDYSQCWLAAALYSYTVRIFIFSVRLTLGLPWLRLTASFGTLALIIKSHTSDDGVAWRLRSCRGGALPFLPVNLPLGSRPVAIPCTSKQTGLFFFCFYALSPCLTESLSNQLV